MQTRNSGNDWFCYSNRSACVAILSLMAMCGCGDKPSSQLVEQSASDQRESLIEPSGRVEAGDQGVVGDQSSEAANTAWQDAIQQVADQQSRSIALNQPVNSSQLNDLAAASEAVELLLDQGVVDDAGMEVIAASLPNLEHLRIRLSPITDRGAEALTELSHLRILNLPQSQIGSQGIRAWAKLPNLEHVRLGGTQLDDAAILALSELPNLQSLHLIGPKISDAGLQSLSQARKLSSLYVDDCQLSEPAWQQLKKSRPDLHIHLDQQHRDRLK